MTRPIHELQHHLEQQRLQVIEAMASRASIRSEPSDGDLLKLAAIQMAIIAIRDELTSHEPKPGSGSETPLE
jgi:hypothetical protein